MSVATNAPALIHNNLSLQIVLTNSVYRPIHPMTDAQISLTAAQLQRLGLEMSVFNIVAARKKEQKAAKKRSAAGVQQLKSPRTQLREAQEKAQQAAKAEIARIEKQKLQQRQADAEMQRAANERQDAQKEASLLRADESPLDDAQDGEGSSSTPHPVVRRRRPTLGPRFTPIITFDGLEARTPAESPPVSVQDVIQQVRAQRELQVLCAMPDGGGVRSWLSLRSPPPDDPVYANWQQWLSPAKWIEMVMHRVPDNSGALKAITKVGNYNEVLEPTEGTPVNDATKWPPQLHRTGVDLTDAALTDVLPDAPYVIRMTRTDPHENKGAGPPEYRWMTQEQLVMEMALTLHAASQGIGPPVYAAVWWPWAMPPGSSEQKYGLLMLVGRSVGSMNQYIANLVKAPAHLKNQVSQEYKTNIELAAASVAELCAKIAQTGHINYDIKPDNMLMHHEHNRFYMTDFDSMQYRFLPDEVAGMKCRLFVNLLLLCMHVRAYTTRHFATHFLAALTPLMIELWKEAVEQPGRFGSGAGWLVQTQIAPNPRIGTLNTNALAGIEDPGMAARRQLEMMTFSYLFDTSRGESPKVARWPHWNKEEAFVEGFPLLVPQLMRFCIFYNEVVPSELRRLFGAAT